MSEPKMDHRRPTKREIRVRRRETDQSIKQLVKGTSLLETSCVQELQMLNTQDLKKKKKKIFLDFILWIFLVVVYFFPIATGLVVHRTTSVLAVPCCTHRRFDIGHMMSGGLAWPEERDQTKAAGKCVALDSVLYSWVLPVVTNATGCKLKIESAMHLTQNPRVNVFILVFFRPTPFLMLDRGALAVLFRHSKLWKGQKASSFKLTK